MNNLKPKSLRQKISKSIDEGLLSIAVIAVIVLYLISLTLETLPSLEQHKAIFEMLENIFTGIFICEFIVRLAVYDKPFKYIFSTFGLIDIASILPAILGANSLALRVLRLFRIFKLFRSRRMTKAINEIKSAIWEIRSDLILFGFVVFVLLFLSAVGIYVFENEAQPEKFSSIPASMWWAVATLTTVGYGDVVPVTTGGKFFTSIVTLIGIGIIAIPTSLVTAALSQVKSKKTK